jgi:hypothetical protein
MDIGLLVCKAFMDVEEDTKGSEQQGFRAQENNDYSLSVRTCKVIYIRISHQLIVFMMPDLQMRAGVFRKILFTYVWIERLKKKRISKICNGDICKDKYELV